MNIWSWLSRSKKRPPVVAPSPAPAGDIVINCSVTGEITDLPILAIDNGHSYMAVKESSSRVIFTVPGTEPPWGFEYRWAGRTQRAAEPLPRAGSHEGPTLAFAPPRPAARQGVVALVGRAWTDGEGPFYPLYTTLLWALGGLHRGEGDRVKQHFRFIREQNYDGVRILCQVNWSGEEIDPNWTNYVQELGTVVDLAYDEGLRTKLTLVGGGAGDVVDLASKVRSVILARRQHKILLIEAVNEGNATVDQAVLIATMMKMTGLPVAVGLGDQGLTTIKSAGSLAGSNVDVLHTERTDGDNGARQVRQAWDFHYLERACDDGEPPGPAGSVREFTDPFKLACMRAAAIICGSGSFCFHTGHGVYGRTFVTRDGIQRYGNLWEAPGIVEQMRAVRNADKRLPRGMENWTSFNTNHPVTIKSGDCNKLYGARSGNSFVEICIGATPTIEFKANERIQYEVINPATGDTVGTSNDVCRVEGLWAYLIVGTIQ